jgi:hypothetical protein
MAVRKKGRSVIEVGGRRFVWHVHRNSHVRIASEDKRSVVSYRWAGEPAMSVSGPQFPGLSLRASSGGAPSAGVRARQPGGIGSPGHPLGVILGQA